MPRVQGTQWLPTKETGKSKYKRKGKNEKKYDLDNRLTAAIQSSNLGVFTY